MDTPMIREAVAVFDDPKRLETAVSDLQSRGFDRSEISFLAHEALARPAAETGSERLAGNPEAPREAATTDTDVRQERLLGTSIAATIAGFAAAGFTVATGGVLAAAAIAAAAAAGGVGAAGAMIGRRLGRQEAGYLDQQLAQGGVLLWVRLGDEAAQAKALEILQRHSSNVSVHEYPADPRDRAKPA